MTQGTERFTRLSPGKGRELVQEIVFYKQGSGKLNDIRQRYLYPTYKPKRFSLTLAKLDDTGTPFSHPLCSWYPRITGWLALGKRTAPLVTMLCCYPALAPSVVPLADSSRSSGSPLVLPGKVLPRSPLVLSASYGLAAHWSCDDLLMTKSIFLK